MNNKITKKRLSDLLSYEWIVIAIVCVVAIVVWELIYSVGAVRLTVGQNFKYYFDTNVSGNYYNLNKLIEDKNALSYDVLSFDYEQLTDQYNVLPTRLTVQEGDILITDCKEQTKADSSKTPYTKLKFNLDNYYGYSFEKMLDDAQNYLGDTFMKDSLSIEQVFAEYNESNLDKDKIENVFRERMKKDNRFRKEHEIQQGVFLEENRVKNLYKEVLDFKKLLSLKDTQPDLFFKYTLNTQSLEYCEEDYVDYWTRQVEKEVAAGRVDHVYALKVEALAKHNPDGTKTDPSKYFTMMGSTTAENICIMVFDFSEQQPHLQYEAISFINTIVRDCSNLLD